MKGKAYKKSRYTESLWFPSSQTTPVLVFRIVRNVPGIIPPLNNRGLFLSFPFREAQSASEFLIVSIPSCMRSRHPPKVTSASGQCFMLAGSTHLALMWAIDWLNRSMRSWYSAGDSSFPLGAQWGAASVAVFFAGAASFSVVFACVRAGCRSFRDIFAGFLWKNWSIVCIKIERDWNVSEEFLSVWFF